VGLTVVLSHLERNRVLRRIFGPKRDEVLGRVAKLTYLGAVIGGSLTG